jgi:hypothetical protein
LNQKPIGPAKPLARPNARASENDIKSMTGKSGPAAPPGHHHIKYHAHGDHRQGDNFHSGSATSSAVPRVQAGKPITMRGNDDGPDAA